MEQTAVKPVPVVRPQTGKGGDTSLSAATPVDTSTLAGVAASLGGELHDPMATAIASGRQLTDVKPVPLVEQKSQPPMPIPHIGSDDPAPAKPQPAVVAPLPITEVKPATQAPTKRMLDEALLHSALGEHDESAFEAARRQKAEAEAAKAATVVPVAVKGPKIIPAQPLPQAAPRPITVPAAQSVQAAPTPVAPTMMEAPRVVSPSGAMPSVLPQPVVSAPQSDTMPVVGGSQPPSVPTPPTSEPSESKGGKFGRKTVIALLLLMLLIGGGLFMLQQKNAADIKSLAAREAAARTKLLQDSRFTRITVRNLVAEQLAATNAKFETLTVTGKTTLNDLEAATIKTGSLTTNSLNTGSINGTNINGGSFTSQTIVVSGGSTLGNTTINGTLSVSGTTSLADLVASGQIKLTGNANDLLLIQPTQNNGQTVFVVRNVDGSEPVSIDANGNMQLAGNLTVGGTLNISTINLDSATIGTLVTTGNATTQGNQTVQGTTTLQGAVNALAGLTTTDLTVSGSTNLQGGLTVAGNINTNGQFTVNGSQISTANLADASNIAYLNGTQTFTGVNTFTGDMLIRPATDSSAALQVQNASGTNSVFVVDTTLGNVGIGTAAPGYTLDVNGNLNLATTLYINGIPICDQSGCGGSGPGPAAAIENRLSLQTGANFNIQSSGAGSVTGQIRAYLSQTADLLQFQNSSGVALAAISADGKLVFGSGADTNLYRSGADSLKTDDSFTVGGGLTVTGSTSLSTLSTSGLATLNSAAVTNNATVGGTLGVTGNFNVNTNKFTVDATTGNVTNAGTIAAGGTISTSGALNVGGTGSSYIMGPLGLGTTTPQAGAALTIANGSWMTGVSADGTSYVNMFRINGSNEIEVGANLNIDGGIVLPTDGGQLTLVDLPISSATSGTPESYTFRVGSSNALTVYGESDGAGGAQNLRVAVGSSISPQYTLDVGGTLGVSGAATLGSTLAVTGNSSLSTLSTSGLATLNSASVTTTLGVTGVATFSNTVNANATGKTAIQIADSGAQNSGITIGGDTNLYRSAAGLLRTDSKLVLGSGASTGSFTDFSGAATLLGGTGQITLTTSNSFALRVANIGDTTARLSVSNTGQLNLGSGSAAADTNLYRSAADTLKTDDSLVVGTDLSVTGNANITGTLTGSFLQGVRATSSGRSLAASVTGDTTDRLAILASGLLQWSNGSGSADTNLYRTSAALLKTDGGLVVSTLGTGGTTVLCSNGSGQISTCSGGGGSYIYNGTSQQASANFNISGTGVINTSLALGQATAASAGLLQLASGTTTANGIYFGTDTALYRSGAGVLATGGQLVAGANITARSGDATQLIIGSVGGNPGISFGSANDTNLYRSAADTLKTDDSLIVQPATNSTDAFRVNQSNGTYIFKVDTSSQLISQDRTAITASTIGGTALIVKNTGTGEVLRLQNNTATNLAIVDNNGTTSFRNASNTSSAFSVQNAGGTAVLNVDTSAGALAVQAGTDTATLGTEQITTTDFTNPNWTSTGWTTTSTTATHNTGNTSALSIIPSPAPVAGQKYQVTYSIGGNPANASTITVTLGGQTVGSYTLNGSGTSTNNFSDTKIITATSTAGLAFTPSSTFDGIVSAVSVKLLSGGANAALVVKNASGVANLEVRASSSTTNSFIGLSAGAANVTGVNLTAVGTSALQSNTTGSQNTAVGTSALQNNTSGVYNTATGYQALQNNTSGSNNTAYGARALQNNTIGLYNVAMGRSALQANTTGINNTAVGYQALLANVAGYNNTAVGYGALIASTSINNTALGYNALGLTTSGGSNTGIGRDSLATNITGGSNAALGVGSDTIYTGQSNSTAVGANTKVGSSNTVVLGSSAWNGGTATSTVIGGSYALGTNLLSVGNRTYITGTIAQTGTTITGTGTAWTAGMSGGTIYYSDGTSATFTYVSGTSATSSVSKSVTGGSTYALVWGGLNVSQTAAALLQNTSDSTKAFQVQNASGKSLFNVDTTNSLINVSGAGTNGAGARLTFGDYIGGVNENVWIGEAVNTDSDYLQLQGRTGVGITTGALSDHWNFFVDAPNGNATFQNTTNSTIAFRVQNAANNTVLVADTSNTRVGIGTVAPAYTLDVAGDVNLTGNLYIGGTLICTSSGCTGGGGGGGTPAVNNQTTLQTSTNFNIQSVADGSITGVIRARSGQTADLLQFQNSTGTTALAGFTANGTLYVGSNTGLSATELTIGGNSICDSTGCTPKGGSAGITNSTALQTTANFNIQSKSATDVTAQLRAYTSQTANLMQFQNSSGTVLTSITAAGAVQGGNGSGANATGTNLTIAGGQGTGTANGGNIVLQVAKPSGSSGSSLNSLATVVTVFGSNGSALFQNSANSLTAFQIQNVGGTTLFDADTTNGRIGIGTTTPGYKLDVAGDVNISTGSAFKINGVTVCDVNGCSASSGSGNYIQNNYASPATLQTNSSFYLQSGTTTTVTARIKALASQTANLLQLEDSAGAMNVFSVSPTGNASFRTSTDTTGALTVQNAAGSVVFGVNTTNGRIQIGNSAATQALSIYAGSMNLKMAPVSTFTVTGSSTGGTLAAGTYYYRVTPIDGFGNISNATSATENSATVTGTTSKITINWAAGALNGAVGGYRVWRGTVAGTPNTYFDVAAGVTSYVDTGSAGTAGSITAGGGDSLLLNYNGDSFINGGKLGVGTASPTSTLHVVGTFKVQLAGGTNVIDTATTTGNVGIGATADSSSKLYVTTSNYVSTVINQSGSFDILQLKNSGTNVATVGSTGATLFKNSSDSTNAFNIQSSTNASLFKVNTTNNAIGIGADPSTAALLTIGSTTTNAAGGVSFATDTALYRGGAGTLVVSALGSNPTSFVVKGTASQASADLFQAQDYNGNILAKIDVNGALTVKGATINGHIITGNATGTTTGAPGSTGGSTGTVVVDGNDTSGTITYTPSGTGITAGDIINITFAQPYTGSKNPHIVITPGNNKAATNLQYFRTVNGSAGNYTGFVINTGVAPVSGQAYIFDYFIAQ